MDMERRIQKDRSSQREHLKTFPSFTSNLGVFNAFNQNFCISCNFIFSCICIDGEGFCLHWGKKSLKIRRKNSAGDAKMTECVRYHSNGATIFALCAVRKRQKRRRNSHVAVVWLVRYVSHLLV